MTSGLEGVLFVVDLSNQSLDDSPSTTRFALRLGLRFGNVRSSEIDKVRGLLAHVASASNWCRCSVSQMCAVEAVDIIS
jgi:hypothetical protein